MDTMVMSSVHVNCRHYHRTLRGKRRCVSSTTLVSSTKHDGHFPNFSQCRHDGRVHNNFLDLLHHRKGSHYYFGRYSWQQLVDEEIFLLSVAMSIQVFPKRAKQSAVVTQIGGWRTVFALPPSALSILHVGVSFWIETASTEAKVT